MNKKLITTAAVIIIIVIVALVVTRKDENVPSPAGHTSINVLSATYEIDGEMYALENGVYEEEAAPGSSSKITVRYFGNEASGDLNSDGSEDSAFLLTKESGGTGLFYYVVAALRINDGYKLTDAALIGDRIAPQSTVITGGKLEVNYADRKPGEPMTAKPSVGVTKTFKVNSDERLVATTE